MNRQNRTEYIWEYITDIDRPNSNLEQDDINIQHVTMIMHIEQQLISRSVTNTVLVYLCDYFWNNLLNKPTLTGLSSTWDGVADVSADAECARPYFCLS